MFKINQIIKIIDSEYARIFNLTGKIVRLENEKNEDKFYEIVIDETLYYLIESEITSYNPKIPEYLK